MRRIYFIHERIHNRSKTNGHYLIEHCPLICYPFEMLRATASLMIIVHGITFACQAFHICLDHVESHSTSGHAVEKHAQDTGTANHFVTKPHGSQSIITVPECTMMGCGTQRASGSTMPSIIAATPSNTLTFKTGQAEQPPDNSPDPPPPRIA